MKKKKRSKTKKFKTTDRTYLSPKGVHVHVPQRKNEGPFTGTVYVKKYGGYMRYTHFNKRGETDKQEWL